MKSNDIKLFRRWDIAIFAFVLLLALFLFLLGTGGRESVTLSVSVDGEETLYSLEKDMSIELESEGITLTLTVENGEVYVSETNCKNKLCSHSGKIDREGQIIVCAPAHISVKLVGNGKGDGML